MTKIHILSANSTRYVDGKPLKGYVIGQPGREAAFIHANDTPRVREAMHRTMNGNHATPQAFMRALLNAEDFTSPVYDAIFRVYYGGEFETIPLQMTA